MAQLIYSSFYNVDENDLYWPIVYRDLQCCVRVTAGNRMQPNQGSCCSVISQPAYDNNMLLQNNSCIFVYTECCSWKNRLL